MVAAAVITMCWLHCVWGLGMIQVDRQSVLRLTLEVHLFCGCMCVVGTVWTCRDVSGRVWTCRDVSGRVGMCRDVPTNPTGRLKNRGRKKVDGPFPPANEEVVKANVVLLLRQGVKTWLIRNNTCHTALSSPAKILTVRFYYVVWCVVLC